jgi:hypothetical protein
MRARSAPFEGRVTQNPATREARFYYWRMTVVVELVPGVKYVGPGAM